MNTTAYTPERYLNRDWLDKTFDFFQVRLKDDPEGRTGYRKFVDKVTGVSKHQLDQRAGRLVHEIVPHVPEEPNFVHWVERYCDKLVDRFGVKLTPREVLKKPVPFDYSRCW